MNLTNDRQCENALALVKDSIKDPERLKHILSVASVFESTDRYCYLLALLHDMIEDGYSDLVRLTFVLSLSDQLVQDLDVITRTPSQHYDEYISRVCSTGSKSCIEVKIADMRNNIERCGDDPEKASLKGRYEKYLPMLEDKLKEYNQEGE